MAAANPEPDAFDLSAEGATAQTLSSLLEEALCSPAAGAVLRSFLEGRGVTAGTWRVHLTDRPLFRLIRGD